MRCAYRWGCFSSGGIQKIILIVIIFNLFEGIISTTTMIVVGTALLALAAAGTASKNVKVHELMTVEEIRQVFQAEPHSGINHSLNPM